MSTRRDMTAAQFADACRRYGFTTRGFMGYYALPCGVEVSVLNAGPTRRERLAYLIECQKKHEAKASV